MNPMTKLVLVKHKPDGRAYLFEAPIDAQVLEGDTVVCKLKTDEISYGIAEAVTIVPICSTEYRFILKSNDAVLPLSRVIGKYEKIDF